MKSRALALGGHVVIFLTFTHSEGDLRALPWGEEQTGSEGVVATGTTWLDLESPARALAVFCVLGSELSQLAHVSLQSLWDA